MALVCGSYAPVAALPEILTRIDSFADDIGTKWTLESASLRSEAKLLDRLMKKSKPAIQTFYISRLDFIAPMDLEWSLDVLAWWLTSFCRQEHRQEIGEEIFYLAVDHEKVELLDLLKACDVLPKDPKMIRVQVKCFKLAVGRWVHEHMNGIRMIVGILSAGKIDFAFVVWAHAHKDEYPLYQNLGMCFQRCCCLGPTGCVEMTPSSYT